MIVVRHQFCPSAVARERAESTWYDLVVRQEVEVSWGIWVAEGMQWSPNGRQLSEVRSRSRSRKHRRISPLRPKLQGVQPLPSGETSGATGQRNTSEMPPMQDGFL